MNRLSSSFPRALNAEQLLLDPLEFLARARSQLGDAVVIRESGSIFSRADNCSGVVAVFGEPLIRKVLSDIETFAMPTSAALKMGLPKNLVNLNRGLHSMRGREHADHKKVVMQILNHDLISAHREGIRSVLDRFSDSLDRVDTISLMSQMRKLTLDMSARVLFGPCYGEAEELTLLLHTYFTLRREASSPTSVGQFLLRHELEIVGHRADYLLRERITQHRRDPKDGAESLLQRLITAGSPGAYALSVDEVVGHTNILFVSSTEPIAISLTWILLVLSQLPELQLALRRELASPAGPAPQGNATSLLDSVINETLRLLTPNALMVRITSRPISLQGVTLPAHSEIVICPFLAHREEALFPNPETFVPSRWSAIRPSPYEYIPFGGGGHFCAGRSIALRLIREVLTSLLPRFDFTLINDQFVDWRIHIMLMPKNDPTLAVRRAGASPDIPSPKWRGPITALLNFGANLA
jgi:cytochrome P450